MSLSVTLIYSDTKMITKPFFFFCHKINLAQYTKSRKWAHALTHDCLHHLISRSAPMMTLAQTGNILPDNACTEF